MIAVIALVLATLSLAMDSLALAYVIRNGRALMESAKPERPYNPKDEGSNWEPIKQNPSRISRIIKRLKGGK